MPKKIRLKRTKRLLGRALAVREHKAGVAYIKDIYQRNFTVPNDDNAPVADFNEMNLSAESQARIKKNLIKQLQIVFIFLFLGLFALIIELIRAQWMGVFGSFIFMCVMLSLAFRYHFWLFQLKQQRLGCSIAEWFQATFKIGALK